MMYSNKMVCCLKANGKVLREFKDTVYVPFGSEYSILIKNLNTVRAIVNITIDGQEVVPDGLVVNANQEIDLERFVKDLTKGNKFKFIERTASIENGPRGIKVDDGLIRVSFKYEVPRPVFNIAPGHWKQKWEWEPAQYISNTPYYGSILRGASGSTGISGSLGGDMIGSNSVTCSAAVAQNSTEKAAFVNQVSAQSARGFFPQASGAQLSATPQSEVGITVPGSISEQKFTTVSNFQTETEEHVMVLRLVGELGQTRVVEAVTVKAKPKCVTCCRTNKATAKFCTNCGTALEIFV